MDRKSSFEPNSVLLYELRQAVRNRAVLVLLFAYLAVLALFLAAAIMPESEILSWISSRTGGLIGDWYGLNKTTAVAMTMLAVYYVFTSVTLVGFAAGKTLGDRLHENPILYSPYAPWRIVLGKLLFGIVVSLLFLSATLPFLAVAYLMRGVDLRIVAMGMLLFFGVTQWHYFATVTFYAGATSKYRAFFCSLPLFSIHLLLSFSMVGVPSLAGEMLHNSSAFWAFFILFTLFFVLMFLAFLLSWVQYAPESSNRMLPVRVSLSVVQGIIGLAFTGAIVYYHFTGKSFDDTGFELAYILFGIFVPFFFPVMICERDRLSYRIRKTIPETFGRRLCVFPFYTGVAGAMAWMFGVILFEGFLLLLVIVFFPGPLSSDYEYAEIVHPFSYGLLCFDYCVTTIILYNALLHRWMSRQWNWVPLFVMLGLPPLFMMTLVFIEIFTSYSVIHRIFEGYKYEMLFFMPVPWPSMNRDFTNNQLLLAVFWACIVVPIGAVWGRRRFLEFQPPSADETSHLL